MITRMAWHQKGMAGRHLQAFMLLFMAALIVPFHAEMSAADDHTYPALLARAGGGQRFGRPWSVTWIGDGQGGCPSLSADGTAVFRKKSLRFRAPGIIRLEFLKAQRPESVSILLARKVRERSRTATGPRTRPSFELEQVTDEQGTVTAWAAVFRGARERHYYTTVYASWQDTEGCGGTQSAAYVVHLQGV